MQLNKEGKIEIITGPMFAGKTEELIRRITRAKIAEQKVVVFKHKTDDRYSKKNQVVSHNNIRCDCYLTKTSEELLKHINNEVEVVAIDEVQFFDDYIVEVIEELADSGITIICSGLDTDFRREPFFIMSKLMAIADEVTKLKAVCFKCKGDANFTQRVVDGKPAKYSSPTILVGGKESYEARCRNCYEKG